MPECRMCGNPRPSNVIPLCPSCARKDWIVMEELHEGTGLIGGNDCRLCSNRCRVENEGLCRIRYREGNRIKARSSSRRALLHSYLDPLPTNCCNSWFCQGSRKGGYNLAVFYYGCNFDCLYCQNWEHKFVERAKLVSIEDMLKKALNDSVRCICHFGGSPEPQLPFALNLSRRVLEERDDVMICWEWNGAGHEKLVLKAGKLSSISGGTVKFDLKAWNSNLHKILTGRDNTDVLKNFESLFYSYPDVLSATTLLVPYYVDAKEVEGIAKFISSFDPEIPYSLLVFHPDYRLIDLPVTPKEQVIQCYNSAKKHLKNVNIGNIHLIGLI